MTRISSAQRSAIDNFYANAAKTADKIKIAGLNNLAFMVRTDTQKGIKDTFDRPTSFIVRSVVVDKASRTTPFAVIKIRHNARRYMEHHSKGGQRSSKGLEYQLRDAGYLPSGWQIVAGLSAPKDKSGNVRRSLINKVAQELNTSPPSQQGGAGSRGSGPTATKYYVITPSEAARTGREAGVYQRMARRSRMLFYFAKSSSINYRKRFDMRDIGRRSIAINADRAFTVAAQRLIARGGR